MFCCLWHLMMKCTTNITQFNLCSFWKLEKWKLLKCYTKFTIDTEGLPTSPSGTLIPKSWKLDCIVISFTKDCIVIHPTEDCFAIPSSEDCIVILVTVDCIVSLSTVQKIALWFLLQRIALSLLLQKTALWFHTSCFEWWLSWTTHVFFFVIFFRIKNIDLFMFCICLWHLMMKCIKQTITQFKFSSFWKTRTNEFC